MFTFFHHLLPLLGLLAGAAVGWKTGWTCCGVGGGILGIVLGAILGGHAARLPGLCILWTISRQMRAQSTASLLEDLYGPASAPANLILLELDRRGEQIQRFLPRVGELLMSTDHDSRCRGWAAMFTAYSDLAEQVSNYSPVSPAEERRAALKPLAEQLFPPGASVEAAGRAIPTGAAPGHNAPPSGVDLR